MEIVMTPAEVLACFTPSERLRENLVGPHHILLAQEKFLVPRFGRRFMDHLCGGQHKEFLECYLKSPLVILVRYLVLGENMAQLTSGGVHQHSASTQKPASMAVVERLRRMLLSQATTLLDVACEAAEQDEQLRVLYEPCRCSERKIIGGVIL